jgi:hypothetical protein
MANIQHLDRRRGVSALAIRPDGSPQVTPVVRSGDDLVRVNTAKGKIKAHNLKKARPWRARIADGITAVRFTARRVGRVTEAGADQHIDSLAKKYLGQDQYGNAAPGEVRLLCEIEPVSASGMG